MVMWLSCFFYYLERYFIAQRSLRSLNEVGLTCFRDLVYRQLYAKVRDAIISLIDQEREGKQIDRALLKKVSHYLHSSSEPKLLEKVQHELLSVYANQLLEKEPSGCHALLRDEKVEDLSRMFRLFSKIPRGLDPVANIFKQHFTAEGTALVKQAEDAASNKKFEKKDVGGLQILKGS
ncbi:hypothetical protein NL676_020775 [Syzygium grande]|nr:hypothetical protein NL676_020775 [Syzygium grande]